MTEPQIRDLLSFAAAERAHAIDLAGELAELAAVALDVGASALSIRLTRAARSVASKVELIDRLSADVDEDTIPIVLPLKAETCARCYGTGEVSACRS